MDNKGMEDTDRQKDRYMTYRVRLTEDRQMIDR